MQLKRKLQHSRRAKERMVAANSAGGERGQEVHQAEHGAPGPDPGRHHWSGAWCGEVRSHPRLQFSPTPIGGSVSITQAIAEKSRTIRLPIHITEMLNKLKVRAVEPGAGATPTVTELAEFVELPEDDVKDLMCAPVSR